MNRFCAVFASFAFTFTTASAQLPIPEVSEFLEGRHVEDYTIKPENHGLQGSTSAYTILNYDQEIIEGMWNLLESNEHQEYWKDCLRALRRIGTVDKESIDLNRLIRRLESIEQDSDLLAEAKIELINLGYPAVARHQSIDAFNFLKDRVSFDYWKNQKIETVSVTTHPETRNSQSAQTEAILSLVEMQTEDADELFESLFLDKKYANDSDINYWLNVAEAYRDSVALSGS